MKFLFLEPFYGGSHKNFVQGLISHSSHIIDLISLPARFWKWRMRGAALYFFNKISSFHDYDGLITTNLMSLSDFKALAGAKFPPSLVYFHENQITYPAAPGKSKDFQFGFTDITTALCADRILFNSKNHFNSFFEALPKFLNIMPEFRPKWVIDQIQTKSNFLYPGCTWSDYEKQPVFFKNKKKLPPLIIWNHRWEFDKNPGDFFNALEALLDKKIEFQLAILGESYQKMPKEFITAKKRFKDQIIQYGYIESKDQYHAMLQRGAIVVSTANQENFGISIVEAIRYGCIPILPNRLSYPELIPEQFHNDFLYNDFNEFVEKLCIIITHYDLFQTKGEILANEMEKFGWKNQISKYDNELDKLVKNIIAEY